MLELKPLAEKGNLSQVFRFVKSHPAVGQSCMILGYLI